MLPRLTYITLLLLLLQYAGFGQQPQNRIVQQYQVMDSVMNTRPWNVLQTGRRPLQNNGLSSRASIISLPSDRGSKMRIARKIISVPINKNASANCADTSARLLYRKDPVAMFTDFITKTKDGNILIPGLEADYTTNTTSAHLMKCTPQGDTLWSKLIKGGYPNGTISVYKAFELNDNSLLLAGEMYVPMPYNGRSDPMIMRVTSTGNLIWEKTFKTRLWDSDTTEGSIDILDCKQDAAGNLYLGGDVRHASLPRQALGFKMDLQGNILWSRAFATGAFPEITGVDVTGNKVTFAGRMVDVYYYGIVNFGISADAATGDTLSTTGFGSATNDFWHAFYGNNMVKLHNGNLVLFGRSSSDGTAPDNIHMPTHAGMIEFTPDLHFVRSYILRSDLVTNVYNTVFSVFEDGSASFTWLNNFSGYSADVTFGSFKNGQIIKERIIPYRGLGIAWVSNFLQMDDGGQVLTNEIGDSVARMNYIEFMRLHNTDTSGSCLGKDASNTIVESQYYYNQGLYFDSIVNNVLTENIRPFDGIYNNNFTIQSGCKQISFCDTLHLLSSRDTVCENVPVNITLQKNKECGAYPLWNYDTTVVSSFYKINDSTVQVTFNRPWQGFIHSTIEGCKMLEDSVKLTVLVAPAKLDIGPDTSICPGNTVVLNAKTGYASYKWQDGSKDSTLTVSQPGTYYVTAMDACGGIFSDTVKVGSHPPIPFDIGPDISICANDTAMITAPQGFLHYQWSSYNIIPDTGQRVKVFPAMNFMYKVTAEKTPGCFASDSILVTVKTVPPVPLGNDTSFCTNQFVVLNAGNGFDTYAWSTGESTEQIVADHQGIFSVKATLNGCSSYDTLQILNVYPLPDFSLGNDTALCRGQLLHYNFNLSQASYKWSTGSTFGSQTITQPGTYWLQVTQMGCVNSDTMSVTYNPLPLVSLGNDTALCEKQSLQLNAYNNNASYLWQDGSIAPGYLVKNAGRYSVTVDLNNCTTSDTVDIIYKALPFFTLGKDSFLCSGQQYILKPVINTNAGLLWQDGSSASSFTIIKDGIYFLTATNECGSYTDSTTITTGFCDIMMPSGFTPNGDGVNDIFKVKYLFPVKQFNLVIYDRWGEKVFETNKISEGWDGTLKGLPSPQSSYVWIISFTDVNNKQQQLKGFVTLLR